jgi:putative salt-induced outer membrane protein YdiY
VKHIITPIALIIGMSVAMPASASIFMYDDANDLDTKAKKDWDASAELGLLFTSGNTKTQTLRSKLSAARDYENWRHKGVIDYYRAKQENQATGVTATTGDKLFLSAQSNYKFSPASRSSVFIFTSYEEDKFSGFEYQGTVAFGYGARYRYSENLFADYEVGPGYAVNKPIVNGVVQGQESSAILRIAGNLVWDVSKNSKFNALAATEIGQDNTKSRAEVSISANVNSSLALKFSISGTHNSFLDDPTKEKLDTETAVTLVYSF